MDTPSSSVCTVLVSPSANGGLSSYQEVGSLLLSYSFFTLKVSLDGYGGGRLCCDFPFLSKVA